MSLDKNIPVVNKLAYVPQKISVSFVCNANTCACATFGRVSHPWVEALSREKAIPVLSKNGFGLVFRCVSISCTFSGEGSL